MMIDEEVVLRSELYPDRKIYPYIHFGKIEDSVDYNFACEIECNCGYLTYVRKMYSQKDIRLDINELQAWIVDFKKIAKRIFESFNPNTSIENVYKVEIIEDIELGFEISKCKKCNGKASIGKTEHHDGMPGSWDERYWIECDICHEKTGKKSNYGENPIIEIVEEWNQY